MLPFRHLLGLVAISLAITAAMIGAVYFIGPEPERAGGPAPSFATPSEALDARALYRERAEAVFSLTALDDEGGVVTGTGFLVDDRGRMLTNEHVISGASRISVAVGPGLDQVGARVLGADPGRDVALLEVDLPEGVDPAPIPLGSAEDLSVGDPVLVIGSPFGLDRSASAGIVSALGRQIQAPDGFPIPGAIQTDAAINHGNSGGPLLDRTGRAVGISTQIASSGVDANVGVAFAVPIDLARADMDRWLAGEQVGHAWVGVKAGTVPGPLARRLGLERGGVQVLAVTPGGPADLAGIRPALETVTIDGVPYLSGGDVLLEAGGRRLARFEDLQEVLAGAAPGERLRVRVQRAQRTRSVTLTLRPRP